MVVIYRAGCPVRRDEENRIRVVVGKWAADIGGIGTDIAGLAGVGEDVTAQPLCHDVEIGVRDEGDREVLIEQRPLVAVIPDAKRLWRDDRA